MREMALSTNFPHMILIWSFLSNIATQRKPKAVRNRIWMLVLVFLIWCAAAKAWTSWGAGGQISENGRLLLGWQVPKGRLLMPPVHSFEWDLSLVNDRFHPFQSLSSNCTLDQVFFHHGNLHDRWWSPDRSSMIWTSLRMLTAVWNDKWSFTNLLQGVKSLSCFFFIKHLLMSNPDQCGDNCIRFCVLVGKSLLQNFGFQVSQVGF